MNQPITELPAAPLRLRTPTECFYPSGRYVSPRRSNQFKFICFALLGIQRFFSRARRSWQRGHTGLHFHVMSTQRRTPCSLVRQLVSVSLRGRLRFFKYSFALISLFLCMILRAFLSFFRSVVQCLFSFDNDPVFCLREVMGSPVVGESVGPRETRCGVGPSLPLLPLRSSHFSFPFPSTSLSSHLPVFARLSIVAM